MYQPNARQTLNSFQDRDAVEGASGECWFDGKWHLVDREVFGRSRSQWSHRAGNERPAVMTRLSYQDQ